MSPSLEARIARLEDKNAISETVIRYCLGVDLRDWLMFENCFTDPVNTGYGSDAAPTGTVTRADLVSNVASALNGFTTTQHLSTNHVIEFDDDNGDHATCTSSMFAQHLLEGSPNGAHYLLRAIYTNYLRRTDDGWRIEGIETDQRWSEGNETAVDEARVRARTR